MTAGEPHHVHRCSVVPDRPVVGAGLIEAEQGVALTLDQQGRDVDPARDARRAGPPEQGYRRRRGPSQRRDLLVYGADGGQETAALGGPGRGAGTHRPLGEQQAGPLSGEDAAGRAAASRVREQRGGQVVPGDLRDDGVDPVIVGRGQQRDPATIGRPGDADPGIARVIKQHPRLPGQPADQLLGVLDLVVGRVQPDLPGRGAEAPRRPGQDGEARSGQLPGLGRHRGLGLAKTVREQDRRDLPGARRREEGRVDQHVIGVTRPVSNGNDHVLHADRHGAAGRQADQHRAGDEHDGRRQPGHGTPSGAPARTHEWTVATPRHQPGRAPHPGGGPLTRAPRPPPPGAASAAARRWPPPVSQRRPGRRRAGCGTAPHRGRREPAGQHGCPARRCGPRP